MSSIFRSLTAAVLALGLLVVPTGSIRAASPSIAQPTAQQASAAAATNPWLTLSAMSGNSASASAAVAAASQAEAQDDIGFPPNPTLAVMLGTIALGVWILLAKDRDGRLTFDDIVDPVSPA